MPTDPNEDPRKAMSSGGPAPIQPTQPPAPTGSPGIRGQTWTPPFAPVPQGQAPAFPTQFGGLGWGGPASAVPGSLGTTGWGGPAMIGASSEPYYEVGHGHDFSGVDGAPATTPGGAPQIPGLPGAPGSTGGGVGQLEGLDFTQRGALENYQRDHAGYFNGPTLSEMFAKDAISRGGGPGPSNRAEQAYQQFNGSQPANMDAYYDNERRKGEENIRRQMAARGSYGSSAADDLYNEMDTNLAADEAKANAQYGLQRGSLLGSLAQGADSSSLAGSADKRNWTSVLGGLAGQGDQAGLSRVIGGANVAGQAQGAQRTRGQDAFNNQLQMGDRMSGIMGQGYGDIFSSDMDLMKTITGLNTGTAAEGYNQASQNALQQRQNVSNFNNLLGGNLQAGQGVYDFLSKPPATPPPSPMPTGTYTAPPADQNYGTTNWYQPGTP